MPRTPVSRSRTCSLGFGTVEVLKRLNLDIAEGEFLVLLGPSGCGKSTLLNCIAGLLDITDGQIFIKGKNVTWEEPKDRGIGMVFQSYALYPQMTVRGEPLLRPEERRHARRPRSTSASSAPPRSCRSSRSWSASPPRSPAASASASPSAGRWCATSTSSCSTSRCRNLDAKLRSELRVEIKRLHQRLENTMIYVTHDQIEAMTLADRIAVMKGGVIQQLDDPQTIYNGPVNRFVAGFIGSPAMNFIKGEVDRRRAPSPEDGDHACRSTAMTAADAAGGRRGDPGRPARAHRLRRRRGELRFSRR